MTRSSFVPPEDDDRDEESEDDNRDEESEDDDGDEESKRHEEEAVHDDSSDDDDSNDSLASYRREAAERRAEAAAELKIFEDEMEAEVRHAGLNRRALLRDAEDPPNDATPTATSHARLNARIAIPRGLTNEESNVPREETHVKRRIVLFVKTDLFRKIKFVNSATMFQRAFRKVIEFEKVRPQMHYQFQMTYEKIFNTALNQKRSSCEQSGLKIKRKQLPISKNAEKTSSHLKNCVSSGEQQRIEKGRRSSGSTIPTWNVYAGQDRGEMERRLRLYRRHEMRTIPKL